MEWRGAGWSRLNARCQTACRHCKTFPIAGVHDLGQEGSCRRRHMVHGGTAPTASFRNPGVLAHAPGRSALESAIEVVHHVLRWRRSRPILAAVPRPPHRDRRKMNFSRRRRCSLDASAGGDVDLACEKFHDYRSSPLTREGVRPPPGKRPSMGAILLPRDTFMRGGRNVARNVGARRRLRSTSYPRATLRNTRRRRAEPTAQEARRRPLSTKARGNPGAGAHETVGTMACVAAVEYPRPHHAGEPEAEFGRAGAPG